LKSDGRGQFRPDHAGEEIVMKTYDQQRYAMLLRITGFGVAHRDLFPAHGAATQLFAAVEQAVDQLSLSITAQKAGRAASRESAVSKAAARKALNRALDAIARTARALDIPGLRGKFYLPPVRNDHEAVTAARRFMRDAAPLKEPLIAHGLPKSFLADLQDTLDAFDRAAHDRLSALETRAEAVSGLGTAMSLAIDALTRLDAVVANTLRDQEWLLETWTKARRVRRVRLNGARAEVPAGTSSTGATADAAVTGALTLVPGSSKTPDTGNAA
jgi:hypothetical protein